MICDDGTYILCYGGSKWVYPVPLPRRVVAVRGSEFRISKPEPARKCDLAICEISLAKELKLSLPITQFLAASLEMLG